jgi:hypothetical protein
MTLTPEHLQIAGIVIVVLIGLALLWWLVRVTVARPKRGQTAYWLQPRDEDNDRDDDIDDDDSGVHR